MNVSTSSLCVWRWTSLGKINIITMRQLLKYVWYKIILTLLCYTDQDILWFMFITTWFVTDHCWLPEYKIISLHLIKLKMNLTWSWHWPLVTEPSQSSSFIWASLRLILCQTGLTRAVITLHSTVQGGIWCARYIGETLLCGILLMKEEYPVSLGFGLSQILMTLFMTRQEMMTVHCNLYELIRKTHWWNTMIMIKINRSGSGYVPESNAKEGVQQQHWGDNQVWNIIHEGRISSEPWFWFWSKILMTFMTRQEMSDKWMLEDAGVSSSEDWLLWRVKMSPEQSWSLESLRIHEAQTLPVVSRLYFLCWHVTEVWGQCETISSWDLLLCHRLGSRRLLRC